MRIQARFVSSLLVFALSACGGGGGNGDGGNTPPPATPATYTIDGVVAGLSGTVVLQNNAANNLSVSTNGAFAFSASAATGIGGSQNDNSASISGAVYLY